jgi:hypothetical protein
MVCVCVCVLGVYVCANVSAIKRERGRAECEGE